MGVLQSTLPIPPRTAGVLSRFSRQSLVAKRKKTDVIFSVGALSVPLPAPAVSAL